MFRINKSILTKLSLVFVGFLILVSGSVTATFYAVDQQAEDTLVTGLAGHQRVLVSSFGRYAIGLQPSYDNNEYYHNLINLSQAAEYFSRTHDAMIFGGETTYEVNGETVIVPEISDGKTQAQLEQIQDLWLPISASVEDLLAGASGNDRHYFPCDDLCRFD